jgi:hypothetical protein
MDEQERRDAAAKRIKTRRDFMMHLGSYVIINAMMIAIWALGSRVGFWPIWILVPWGVGLAFHGWWVFFGQPISERDIEREMER